MIGETLAASLLSLNTGPCFLRPLDISYSSSSLTQPLPLAQKQDSHLPLPSSPGPHQSLGCGVASMPRINLQMIYWLSSANSETKARTLSSFSINAPL